MSKKKVRKDSKRIENVDELGNELTTYIFNHPDLLDKHSEDIFVIFSEKNTKVNKKSEKLYFELKRKGKKVIKAIRKPTIYNKWAFETTS